MSDALFQKYCTSITTIGALKIKESNQKKRDPDARYKMVDVEPP